MRICIVAEGCYPYTAGGVSSWADSLVKSLPEHEFVIMAVLANRDIRGKFAMDLPENVVEVHEVYLDDLDWYKQHKKKKRIKNKDFQALRSLMLGSRIDWEGLIDFFQSRVKSLDDLLMGEDFMNAVTEFYLMHYSQMVFTDFLWTMRSVYLPLFRTLQAEVPKADVYHCLSTGYAGVLACVGKQVHGGRMLLSEHGIYTREREEELLQSKWVKGIFRNIWSKQFYKMSDLAYTKADAVTCLYNRAKELQTELGCPREKIMVVPNGVDFAEINAHADETYDDGFIHVGAALRIASIKDVKTLIQAYAFAKEKDSRLKLHIMGPWDENDDYAKECFEMVELMQIPDIEFTGRVNMSEYYPKMDFMILTSISEGQPLVILESFAAGKPVIATDVGNCGGLLFGDDENDTFGPAGILTGVMDIEGIMQAILKLAGNGTLRNRMGQAGHARGKKYHTLDGMLVKYKGIYNDFEESLSADGDYRSGKREG